MLRAELKKLIKLGRLPLIIVIALAVRFLLCIIPAYNEHPYSPEVYRQYTEEYCGELTEEKLRRLNERLAEIEELLGQYEEMQDRYVRGELTLEEYSDYTERHGKAAAEYSTVEYLCRKWEALNACSTFDRKIFYDTDWSDLFGSNGFDFVMLLAMLCIAVPAFDSEYSSGSFSQLLTSKRGRGQLAAAKVAAVVVSVFILSVMMSGVRLGVFAYRTGLAYSKMPVGNILLTDGFGSTTLMGYYINDALVKAIVIAVYSAAVCLISTACRSTVFSLVLAFIISVTPMFLADCVQGEALYIISGALLGKMYPADVNLSVFFTVSAVKLSVLTAATVRLWGSRRK
ncbi:MAG: ABC transporter permease subunit [Ruminococcus sp.]|nr:ABC transporter permease subunit [Ruminococcus sp.]